MKSEDSSLLLIGQRSRSRIQPFLLHRPGSAADAVAAFEGSGGSGKAAYMAGGIDLIDCFKSGLHRETVIHLAGIAGLGGIAGKNGDLVIGAAVTHEQFAKDPALVRFFPALAQEWSCLANPRIRAVGTLGGNVMAKNCNYDAVALALAADAELRFAQCAGVVTRKANEPWEPSDLLLEIRIKQASKRRLGDGLGIVVIVLLPLHERLHIHRRNDPRFMPERPQSPAYEMSADTPQGQRCWAEFS